MDTATAIEIGRKAMKVAEKAIKYVKADNEKHYGLAETVSAVLAGDNVTLVRDGHSYVPVKAVTTKDGSLTVTPCEDGLEFAVRLVAHPFPAEAKLWNGPDLIKDDKYRSMLASLFHDLIWGHAQELATAWDVPKSAVLSWGNGVLYALWTYASGDSLLGRLEARIAWHACEFSKGWYHAVKKWLGLSCVALCFGVSGCATPPDWSVIEIEGTNAVIEAMGQVEADGGNGGSPGILDALKHLDLGGASAKSWKDCKRSSNWNGNNASQRMMNLVSPAFSDAKAKEYLDWQTGLGCDHVHLLLVNKADGEGAGYDCLADANAKAVALKRVKEARSRGLGVVAWIVADDSDAYRKEIFKDPAKYAAALKDYMPYLSYIVLGLEMNEGEGSAAKWQSLRDAIKAAGWTGKFATHHTSGKYTYAGLGEIVMDQRDPKCSAADVESSVKALVAKGYAINGFEYERGPNKAKAQAALNAGAFGCGNWGK